MPALKDLTGQKFGRLTVISRAPNQGRYVCWNCKCDCGNDYVVRSTSLVSGRTQSCGCLYKETRPKGNDLVGQRFGKLVVVEKTNLRKDGHIVWKCKCDCGGMTLAKSNELSCGMRVSCGCKGKSAGETIIDIILQEAGVQFKYNEAIFKDLVMPKGQTGRYDFTLIDSNGLPYRLIEYDGEQHFRDTPIFSGSLKERQQYDAIKNEYALKNNIPLVRIPYWELQNINIEMLLGDKYLIKESGKNE